MGAILDSSYIWGGFIKPGTVLWNGEKAFAVNGDNVNFQNNNLLVNQNISLGFEITKLKNGLQISINKFLYWNNANAQNNDPSKGSWSISDLPDRYGINPNTYKISKADLQNGANILIATAVLGKSVYIKQVDKQTITFVSNGEGNYGNETKDNSTAISRQDYHYNTWLIIDSITAY